MTCGGHYLCSVAAKGHTQIVKPERFGVRNGGRIICNRQLLISNAFEDFDAGNVSIFAQGHQATIQCKVDKQQIESNLRSAEYMRKWKFEGQIKSDQNQVSRNLTMD